MVTPAMSPALRWAMLVTDIVFLLYWAISLAALVGLLALPAGFMYGGFDQTRVMAWNWSFLPLDLAFSVAGLLAVAAARRGDPAWRPLALISLCLTATAGGMAIGYWTILGEFDPAWFLPNLAIFLWPFLFLPRLVKTDPMPDPA